MKLFKKPLAIIAAISGVLAGVLYQYHLSVIASRPDDIVDTLALYLLITSIVFWFVFLALHVAFRGNTTK